MLLSCTIHPTLPLKGTWAEKWLFGLVFLAMEMYVVLSSLMLMSMDWLRYLEMLNDRCSQLEQVFPSNRTVTVSSYGLGGSHGAPAHRSRVDRISICRNIWHQNHCLEPSLERPATARSPYLTPYITTSSCGDLQLIMTWENRGNCWQRTPAGRDMERRCQFICFAGSCGKWRSGWRTRSIIKHR